MTNKKPGRDYFVDRLYKGELKRIKSGERKKKERIDPDSAQGKDVIQKCKGKCVLCDSLYTVDPHTFAIHHINGNPQDTQTRNLTLMCSNCHNSIHGEVDKKTRNYKASTSNKKSDESSVVKKQKIVSVNCPLCEGSGTWPDILVPCPACRGKGKVQVYDPPKKCTVCGGSGGKPVGLFGFDPCENCGGTGYQNAVKLSKYSRVKSGRKKATTGGTK